MRVTFCGHAEIAQPEAVQCWLSKTINLLIEQGADTFYLGGYGAFDCMAAKTVWELKRSRPDIRSVLVLPYLEHSVSTAAYDSTVYPSLEHVPRQYAIIKRNEYMVKWADVVLAYVLYSWGGAARTLAYATRKKKRIIQFSRTSGE